MSSNRREGKVFLSFFIAFFILLSFSVVGQVYVDGVLGDDAFDGSAPVPGIPPEGPKKTINAAVAVTTPSFTIYIASAVYLENVNATGTLTLAGASRTGVIVRSASGSTIDISAADCRVSTMTIQFASGGQGINVAGVPRTVIDNCAFSGPDLGVNLGMGGGSNNTTIRNCSFSGCQAVQSGGNNNLDFTGNACSNSSLRDITFHAGNNFLVQNCSFSKPALSSIHLERASLVTIEGCTIDEACYNITLPSAVGEEFGAITSIGDRFTSPPSPDSGLVIRNNSITGTKANSPIFGAFVPGNTYRTGAIGFDLIPNNCVIENNTFENNLDGGIQINRRVAGITPIQCRRNNFIGNGGQGFEINPAGNDDPFPGNFVIADLSLNYWGAATGPGSAEYNPTGAGAVITLGQPGDNADISPWLGYRTGSSPQSYYVTRQPGIPDTQTTINEALGETASGDSIFVKPGTYSEGLDIPHALILKSVVGPASTIIDGTGTARAGTGGLDIPITVTPSSDDLIIIDGFTVDNSDIGIRARDTGGNPGDKIIISYCYFDNVDINGTALVVEYCQAEIRNNIINGQGAGIRLANASNSVLSGNIVRNGNNYGITVADENVGGLGAFTCENIEISSNRIYNLNSTFTASAYGIFLGKTDGSGVAPFCKNVTVSDNTITTCGHPGLVFDGQNEPGDGALLVYGNTIQDCGNYSPLVTTDGIWSISTLGYNYNVHLSGNIIRYHSDIGVNINDGDVKMDYNTITNNGTGIVVLDGTVDLGYGPLGSWGMNTIENNSTLNLHNISPLDMMAKGNRWGSNDYNTVELTIDHKPDNPAEGLVNFLPMMGDPAPDPVWVSRAYTPATVGWGYDHFDSIQDGAIAVAWAGDVYVADGVYDNEEDYPIVIPKCETIYGTSRAGTVIRSPSSFLDSVAENGTILLDVNGDKTTIANLTLDGDNNPSLADDATFPELGHGDSDSANDVNALCGIRLNPPDTGYNAFGLMLDNILFKNLHTGLSLNGRPGEPDEISPENIVEDCVFENIGAGDGIFKNGAGIFFTSAELEVSSNTFTRCDTGIRGLLAPGSSDLSALSAHDNTFLDNYFGIFLDGSRGSDPSSGITTFDPDDGGTITEGIADNMFNVTTPFRTDSDGWEPAAGDFVDHFNLDGSTTGTYADTTPPTMNPDTPAGIFMISGTDPVLITYNMIFNMRRGLMILSERGAASDDATATILTNWIIGPGTATGFDAVGILARNRQIYGDSEADDDFGGDVKLNLSDTFIDGGVDLIRLQEEPVSTLEPTSFYVTLGGDPGSRNTFGLIRDQAINLRYYNLAGGGERDDVDATYNDFLVNLYEEVEAVVYHKVDESYLGLVTFLPARRLANNLSLVAVPPAVADYNVTVDLTATVTDGFGDPVADLVPVIFQTDFGVLGTTNPVPTNGGQALNTLISNIDGVANVVAGADAHATDTVTIPFDVTGMETIYYYPFNDPDLEGWRVGDPPPGTYVNAQDGAFYMAPSTRPAGQIGVLDKYTVNLYGYWHLKDSFAIEYVPDKVYRARYRIRTDQSDRYKVPQARLRWNNIRNYAACYQIVDRGLNAPSDSQWTDYYSYYLPPDFTGLADEDQDLILNFDLVDFTDIQTGSLFLDEVEVVRFNPPTRAIATYADSYETQADFDPWVELTIPETFGLATLGSDNDGLYLETGATPSPPAGKETLPDYGAWELPAQLAAATYEPDQLYRAVFTLKVPDEITRQTMTRVRMRLHNGASDWNTVYEIFQIGMGAYHDHLPTVTGTEYSVFMESPRGFYPTTEAFKNRIVLAIDVVDGRDIEFGRVYLTKVEVEYYDIP